MCPLMSMTQVLHQKVGELTTMLFKKEAEIQDYKENGAVLSRGAHYIYVKPFSYVLYMLFICCELNTFH